MSDKSPSLIVPCACCASNQETAAAFSRLGFVTIRHPDDAIARFAIIGFVRARDRMKRPSPAACQPAVGTRS